MSYLSILTCNCAGDRGDCYEEHLLLSHVRFTRSKGGKWPGMETLFKIIFLSMNAST